MTLLEPRPRPQPSAHCAGVTCVHDEVSNPDHVQATLFGYARSAPRHRARRARWTPPVERYVERPAQHAVATSSD
ncbi:hypothetical protein BH11ACT3_BH11ACT3_18050 [soil metagenome]